MANLHPIENEDGKVIATFRLEAATELASSHSPRGARQNIWTDLYRTAKGRYVLHRVNQWQGARCWYELASVAEAARFAAEYASDQSALPEDLRAEIAKMEI